ncbi:hypothetical protein [Streptomyces boninensis]|uniref:hypothetical protein n=1 Tax=Streptomyces boninensis TaxID=2039455 RepID=UPI003B214924
MGTSGKAQATALLLAGVSLCLAAGCSSGGGGKKDRAAESSPARTTSAAPTGPPQRGERACAVKLPAGWRKALGDGEIDPAADGAREVLTAVGPGAAWAVVQSTDAGERTLQFVPESGERRDVAELGDPVEDQVDAADYDGRWLAYDLVRGRQAQSPWELVAWDAQSGKSKVVARADRDGEGQAVPGPFVQPVVRSGRVFWAQGIGGGKSAVYAEDLGKGGKRTTLYKGVADVPFAAGGVLVWPQAQGKGGTDIHLAAASLDSLKPAELPPPIARLRGVRVAGSDGRTWAWVGGKQGTELRVWRPGWKTPATLVADASEAVNGMDQVQVSGDLVTWRSTEAAWALDLRSRSYTRVTPQYGYAQARDDAIGVSYAEGEAKSAESTAVNAVVQAGELPALPRCER